jgi:uncharacterized protein (TIGR02466 family)
MPITSELRNTKVFYAFPSPCMFHLWSDGPEINKELQRTILAHEAASAGFNRTNIGGWHSEVGNLEWLGELGALLIRRFEEMGNEATRQVLTEFGQKPTATTWTVQAWVNVNRTGDFNKTHSHPGSTWSGTYYVAEGDPPADAENGTPIHIMDPSPGRVNTFLPPLVPSGLFIRPQSGLMILFPSYLPHMVYAHRGTAARISIAFNLRKEPFP